MGKYIAYMTSVAIRVVTSLVIDELDIRKYAIRVGRVIDNVEREKQKLILTRDLVQERVVEAAGRNTTEMVKDDVLQWLIETEKLVKEVENPKIKTDMWFSYRELGTDHAMTYFSETLSKIRALNVIGSEFDQVSDPIPSLGHFSSADFVCFEATKECSDRLLEALRDDNCYIIGLYGKPGSGKTKLVKAMREKAKYLKIFDEVIFIKVSQNPNFRRLQDEIAESLNLNRAILVILDDVRAKLDLKDIGIPCNSDSNRCKILFTMRDQALMDCQREIPLGSLSREEAWTLFKKHSSINDDESRSDILNVAWDIAFECEGLLGTIKDVGTSLKGIEPIEEWKATLDSLRHSVAQYHIFLSFRGEDTRYSFTGFLYRALCQEGFKTFRDDRELKTGDQISPSLINAIETSRLSIIVLSDSYASSSWCLDELVKILECMEKNNQLVWPIFYKVEPSEVRHQKNSWGKAMAEHENKFGIDSERVKKWRSALFQVSNLSGKPYKSGMYEYEFIQKMVEDVNNIKHRLYIRSMDMD